MMFRWLTVDVLNQFQIYIYYIYICHLGSTYCTEELDQ